MNLIIAITCLLSFTSATIGLTRDYCPMAVGNWWTYQGPYGILKQTVASMKKDSFVVIDSTWAGNQVSVQQERYCLHDENGYVEDWFRGYFGMNFFFSQDWPAYDSIIVPAGVFYGGVLYRNTGHGVVGPVQNVAIQGVGNVAQNCDYADQPSCGFKLSQYHVQTVPEAAAHTVSAIAQPAPDTFFSYSALNADTARLVFRLKCRSTAHFDLMTSYKQVDSSLRVFVVDTADTEKTTVFSITEHSVRIKAIRSMPFSRIRVYLRETKASDYLNILKYDRTIPRTAAFPVIRHGSPEATPVGATRKAGSFTIQGRRVTPADASRILRASIMIIIEGESR